jgi:hypothetical protein
MKPLVVLDRNDSIPYFRVFVSKRRSDNGKRQVRYFRTKKAAKAFCDDANENGRSAIYPTEPVPGTARADAND